MPITPDGPWRYADLRPDLARRRFYAVREDHSGEGEPANTIVDHPARRRGPAGARQGLRFRRRAAPLAGRHAARLARVGPPGHALGRDACCGSRAFEPDGTLGEAILAAGGPDESIVQPEWAPDGTLHLISDRNGLVEPLPPGRRATARAAGRDGGGVRRPALDLRPVDATGSCPTARSWPSPARAGATTSTGSSPAPASASWRCPFTELEGLRVGAHAVVALAGRAGRSGRHRPLRSGDAGTGRRPAPGEHGHLRPGDHRRARVDRVPDDRRPDRARALLPADQPGLPRPRGREAAAHRAVARRPDVECLHRARPREAVHDQPRHRDRRRRLRREHRLRPRVPPPPRRTVGRRRRRRLRGGCAVPRRARRRGPGPAGHRGRQRRRLHDARGPGLPRRLRGRDQPLRDRRPGAARHRQPQVRVAATTGAWSARIPRPPPSTANARRAISRTDSRARS